MENECTPDTQERTERNWSCVDSSSLKFQEDKVEVEIDARFSVGFQANQQFSN